MRAGDFPYEDFTNGKDGRLTESLPRMNLTGGCTRHPNQMWTPPRDNATSVCDERQPPQLMASLVWKRTQRGLLWVAVECISTDCAPGFPVADSTMPLASGTGSSREDWTHTGYKNHAVGLMGLILAQLLVILTFIGIQFLMFLLTILYYMQQEAITRWSPVLYDEVQVLKAFEIVWMVGFIWCFASKKYPASIRSLFLRRCPLDRASRVALVAPTQDIDVASDPGVGDKVASVL
jgi:hypothetical protein